MMILGMAALLILPLSQQVVRERTGEGLWRAHCASCHGMDGKGGGPAAKALKKTPPDLTTLAQRNKGKFPAEQVEQTILGDPRLDVHGTREMPVWGPAFSELEGDRDLSRVRVRNLSDHIAKLQRK